MGFQAFWSVPSSLANCAHYMEQSSVHKGHWEDREGIIHRQPACPGMGFSGLGAELMSLLEHVE